ncbi:MAG: monovalent cation/H+ antiporter complex subunit F [Actinomycetota bacterium]|nr:monovalent cation/H+ antiporter complex subunit F [Actinomycetota bacterium]
MNEWEIAAMVLTAALLPCLGVCLLAGATEALAAVQVANVLAVSALMALSEGFQRQPFIDLALVLAVLGLIGSLVFARMMEAEI